MPNLEGPSGIIVEPLRSMTTKGHTPIGSSGRLAVDAGAVLKLGQFVKFDTVAGGWKRVLVGDTITATTRIAVIYRLPRQVGACEELNETDVSTQAFENAVLWQVGGDFQIKCSTTLIANGANHVAFNPATHTSLASVLAIFPEQKLDGVLDYWFTFR